MTKQELPTLTGTCMTFLSFCLVGGSFYVLVKISSRPFAILRLFPPSVGE